MKIVGEFDVNSIFKLTGFGIVIAGRIVNGVIRSGDLIDIEFKDGVEQFEISGVEHILTSASNPDPYAFGLLIKNLSSQEEKKLCARTIVQKITEIKSTNNI